MAECLTAKTLTALVDGRIPDEQMPSVQEHLATCTARPRCIDLLLVLARSGVEEPQTSPVPRSAAAAPPTREGGARWKPPESFDQFVLLRRLGQGQMGVVYLAVDRTLDREVAIKFIASPRPDAAARDRFQVEARSVARIHHP